MTEVGIRALKQNASKVVANVLDGQVTTILDRGRPVARIVPLATTSLERGIEDGTIRPAEGSVWENLSPGAEADVSAELHAMREDERY